MKRIFLLLALAKAAIENAHLRWRLRRSGIDQDSAPEIEALRSRFKRGEPMADDNSQTKDDGYGAQPRLSASPSILPVTSGAEG